MPHKGIDIGDWIITIVLSVVLLGVVAGTYVTLLSNANAFANATGGNPMATLIVTLLPVLISASLLILFVFAYLPSKYGHKGK